MVKYALFLNCLLISSGQLLSQHIADIAKENPVLKISMLPMFHIDNAFVLAAQIPFSKGRFSLQPEIGYGATSSNVWYEPWTPDESPDKNTVRSKLQFRSYYKDWAVFRAYYGGEYSYRHSTYRQSGLEGNDNNLAMLPAIRLRRTTHAMHGLLGWQGYFNNRLSIDFHAGFGLRMAENSALTKGLSKEELDQIRFDERDWFRRSKRIGSYGPYPDFFGAIQLGFILGKLDR